MFATIIYKCLLFLCNFSRKKKHFIYKFNILSIQLKISFHTNLTTYSDKKKQQFKQDLILPVTAYF